MTINGAVEAMKPPGFDGRKAEAMARLGEAVGSARKPALLSSFGKDSLCLLSLIDELKVEASIAYFELGAIATAHRFARRVIAEHDLQVTLLRPHRTFVAKGVGGADLAYHFDLLSGDSFQIVGAKFDDSLRPELACGLQVDLLEDGQHAPYDWDLVIAGRRQVDIDSTLGSLRIASAKTRLEHGTELLMALHEWTDEDVAYFLTTHCDYPPDWERYELIGGCLRNRVEKGANPDHAQICIRCFAAETSTPPDCPLLLSHVDSRHALSERKYYMPGNVPAAVML